MAAAMALPAAPSLCTHPRTWHHPSAGTPILGGCWHPTGHPSPPLPQLSSGTGAGMAPHNPPLSPGTPDFSTPSLLPGDSDSPMARAPAPQWVPPTPPGPPELLTGSAGGRG